MPVAFSARAALLSLLAAGSLTACGRDAAEDQPTDEPAAQAEAGPAADSAATPPAQTGAPPTNAPVGTGDIERWEKGIAAEMKAVQEGGAKLKSAKTAEDTMSAMMAVQEMTTAEAGARAAGVDLERYKFIRSNLSAAASYLTPQLGGIDTTMLSPAQRDELRRGNEAQLQRLQAEVPAEVIETLRPRAVELRKKDLELVGTRLKAAGM